MSAAGPQAMDGGLASVPVARWGRRGGCCGRDGSWRGGGQLVVAVGREIGGVVGEPVGGGIEVSEAVVANLIAAGREVDGLQEDADGVVAVAGVRVLGNGPRFGVGVLVGRVGAFDAVAVAACTDVFVDLGGGGVGAA